MGKLRRYFNGLNLSGNIYVALIYRLLLVVVLFAACRVGFYLVNVKSFPNMGWQYFLYLMKEGLRFDWAAILYINSLYIALMVIPFDFRFNRRYQIGLKYLFVTANGLALTVAVIDFIYYKFTLHRITADVFRDVENEIHLNGTLLRFFIHYWYAIVFWIVFLCLLLWLYSVVKVNGPQLKNRFVYFLAGWTIVFMVLSIFISAAREGYASTTHITKLNDASVRLKDPRHINIVLNAPFTILRTMGNPKMQRVNSFSEEELELIYNPVHTPADSVPFKKQNVVVIILESFSTEFFRSLNGHKNFGKYKGYTLFLDSLIRNSLTFEYSIANGRKSVDGLPAVLSSIPSLGVPYLLSPYSENSIHSLASLLDEEGYHTSFFHGAPNGSTGYHAFMNTNAAGVKHYYGKDEYNNDDDFDGVRGIWDEEFLRYYADKLNEFPEPFISSFFSISSQYPFDVPERYHEKFKGGPLAIQQSIEYTDHSLKLFFNRIKKMPWYKNTIFVITANHPSSEIEFPEGRTDWGHYSVPIIFFRPDNSLKRRSKEIAQQVDIMPSVLGYLHYDKPYVAFGRDIMHEQSEPFAFNYNNVYQLYEDQYFFQYDGVKPIGLYDFRRDQLLLHNLLNKREDVQARMEKKMKAIIQQYNNRMIENRLVMKDDGNLAGEKQ
jgi:phosphoglycerol transferase MdoB-like AlkP superfamily enzyme